MRVENLVECRRRGLRITEKQLLPAIALMVWGSSQSVSSLSGRDRFPPLPTNCFELDEGWKVATMWKTKIKYDRKEAVFSTNPGGVEVRPKCFKS